MEFSKNDLTEAKRQIDSTLHKLRETINTFESKENAARYKSQITLAKRRIKAFEIAGYKESDVKQKFGALYNAFSYGTPPHAGAAPGVDRIVMLLASEDNIREVIAFPKNKKARDLLMKAPSTVSEEQLKDVHIKLDLEKE